MIVNIPPKSRATSISGRISCILCSCKLWYGMVTWCIRYKETISCFNCDLHVGCLTFLVSTWIKKDLDYHLIKAQKVLRHLIMLQHCSTNTAQLQMYIHPTTKISSTIYSSNIVEQHRSYKSKSSTSLVPFRCLRFRLYTTRTSIKHSIYNHKEVIYHPTKIQKSWIHQLLPRPTHTTPP